MRIVRWVRSWEELEWFLFAGVVAIAVLIPVAARLSDREQAECATKHCDHGAPRITQVGSTMFWAGKDMGMVTVAETECICVEVPK